MGLWPILTTAIVADDFVGPFVMHHNAGPGLLSNLRVGFEAASFGHFNYLGQTVGGFVNWLWLQLMIFGFRFSTIYALTKFLVIFFLIIEVTRVIKRLLAASGSLVPVWTLRTTIGLCVIGTFQLHLVWSNDPVGSYPMSGYMSALVGLIALEALIIALDNPRVRNSIFGSIALLAACLYYELNIVVFFSFAIVLSYYLLINWGNYKSTIRRFAPLSFLCFCVGVFIVFLQIQNYEMSAHYTGTAVDLSSQTAFTFGRLLVSNLPFSSWHLGLDWMQHVVPAQLLDLSVLAIIAVIAYLLLKNGSMVILSFRSILLVSLTFFVLGVGSTLIQAATQKVQVESTRIGSVYNFYAFGSVAVVVVLGLLLIWLFTYQRSLAVLVLPFLVIASSFQFMLNSAIQKQHYDYLLPSRNVLVAFTENWNEEARCQALRTWLEGPWPPYYSNSLATGMESSFLHYHGEKFCGRN
jgi:hypothetical protein